MKALHQFVHSFVDHDAVSSHTRHVQRLVREMGYESEVFAGEWRGARSKAKFFRDHAIDPESVVLYQLATASPIEEFLLSNRIPFALNYHNFTPYELLAPWEPLVAPELEVARQHLSRLAPAARAGIAPSVFNELELRAAGCVSTSIAPILFDANEFTHVVDAKTDAKLKARRAKGGVDWLFVGRIAPHKCHHDIIRALAVYRRLYDPDARLNLVGGLSSHRYWTALKQFVESLELQDAVDITLGIGNDELGAYYANSDVFVCLSEHEGFGVPVLEAMHHDLPVIAFDSSAVGETTGNGGIVLDEKSGATVAAAVARVLRDGDLRSELRTRGHQRLAEFSLANSEEKWRKVIESLVG